MVLVVLVVWLVIYFAAREQSTEGSGAFGPGSEPGTGTVVSDSTVIARISR
ncbi:hypothetical protein [Blastococcus colisei]|uniref:hypothetical protein n=1 Tax=Blastococcus colisei TaxID=1564162 RepID=UPI0014769FAD|nr:hypothetical protein [Blastococcus colisei]